MPESLVFLLQSFLLLSAAAVLLSAVAWMSRTVLAWILRGFGIPATPDPASLENEEFAKWQALLEERERMSDQDQQNIDASNRWFHDPTGDRSGKF